MVSDSDVAKSAKSSFETEDMLSENVKQCSWAACSGESAALKWNPDKFKLWITITFTSPMKVGPAAQKMWKRYSKSKR